MAKETIYIADLDLIRDRRVIVEGDGSGGAYTMIIEGNYPIDFVVHTEIHFDTEEAAMADVMKVGNQRPSRVCEGGR
jgi:hypothetical protein